MSFILDPRLERDSHPLITRRLCQIRLFHDSRYKWLVLVPQRENIAEIIELPAADQALLWQEVAESCRVLQAACRPDKLNIGALGNIVAQLHIHVIARFRSDPAWPGPVWGHSPALPWGDEARRQAEQELRALWPS